MKFHSLFGSGVKVWSAFMWALLFYSCTSGRDLGYVYGNLEPAYYPKRLRIPGIIDVQKGSKREGLKIKEAENHKKFSLSLKF